MIPENIISEVREKSDIVDLIGEYVPLKQRGRNHVGLCPFHSDQKPSFTVSRDKQIFHCFGCGEGGNIFSFLEKVENISFVEAVKILAEKLGIVIEVDQKKARQSSSTKNKYYDIMEMATKYYQKILSASEKGVPGKKYLEDRGLNSGTIKRFSLGFAPEGPAALAENLKSRQISLEEMEKLGLIIRREERKDVIDRFRKRILFPLRDSRGRVMGFGGRLIREGEPKYLNSPDSPLYRKGHELYGLFENKADIRRAKEAILVEGYLDLLSLTQAGINNVLATLGTALTETQARLINRFISTIILAFDADGAGKLAAEKNAEILARAGIKVRIANLDGEKDPDEFIKKRGKEAFLARLKESLPWTQFKIEMILKREKTDEVEGRVNALRQIYSILLNIPDRMTRREYLRQVAGKLLIDEAEMNAELKRLDYTKSTPSKWKNLKFKTEKPKAKINFAGETLLKLAIESEDVYQNIKEALDPEEFVEPRQKEIARLLFLASEEKERVHFLMENLKEKETQTFLSHLLLTENDGLKKEKKEIVQDCINSIRTYHLKEELLELKKNISRSEKAGKLNEVKEFHQRYGQVSQEIRKLERKGVPS